MIDLARWMEPGELLETFHRVPLRYAPGHSWSYRSPAYVLLAHVVERAAGTPYRDFLAERTFGPLGLSRTFAGAPHGRPDLAQGHDTAGRPVPTWELDVVGMGAGDVWSTARDEPWWHHDGQNAGFISYTARIPGRRRRIVVLTDTETTDTAFVEPLLV